MSPGSALHTHLELADIPIIDKASLAILGNDDFLLSMLRDDASPAMIDDCFVAWTVGATRALGVKVINAGAAAAFKENVRSFALDDLVPSSGLPRGRSSRRCRPPSAAWGSPTRCTSTATISAPRARPTPRPRRSRRPRECRCISRTCSSMATGGRASAGSPRPRRGSPSSSTRRREITIDIGQVMFQQTVTVPSDVLRQFLARGSASPKKFVHP